MKWKRLAGSRLPVRNESLCASTHTRSVSSSACAHRVSRPHAEQTRLTRRERIPTHARRRLAMMRWIGRKAHGVDCSADELDDGAELNRRVEGDVIQPGEGGRRAAEAVCGEPPDFESPTHEIATKHVACGAKSVRRVKVGRYCERGWVREDG